MFNKHFMKSQVKLFLFPVKYFLLYLCNTIQIFFYIALVLTALTNVNIKSNCA